VYDSQTNRFDHHQREFTGVFDGYTSKLSSAGLIYKHFGKEILHVLFECELSLPKAEVQVLVEGCYNKLYSDFMEHIDAIDNGRSIADTPPHYHVSTTLSARVGHLNPAWNEPQTTDIQNSRFIEAMLMTAKEFSYHALYLAKQWWPARSIVCEAVAGCIEVDGRGKFMELKQACPWKDHLYEIEVRMSICFVVN
jgi:uncharacterized UPF0160 family protein